MELNKKKVAFLGDKERGVKSKNLKNLKQFTVEEQDQDDIQYFNDKCAATDNIINKNKSTLQSLQDYYTEESEGASWRYTQDQEQGQSRYSHPPTNNDRHNNVEEQKVKYVLSKQTNQKLNEIELLQNETLDIFKKLLK